jgi:2,4-dienoyl-CoA reductase (NADPH2)
VGAIISSHVPVSVRGRILPNYAMIDRDERIRFWATVVEAVHREECAFILQLSHAGHQQDMGGVENRVEAEERPLSSTDEREFFHGLASKAMSIEEIEGVVAEFVAGARRAKAAGCDGVELHAANGYLFTQFLSSAVNDRHDAYGGSLPNRYRFLQDVVRRIRDEVGPDFHLQVKFSGVDHHDALEPWLPKGTTIEESMQVAEWLERDGADALHVSVGSYFPHPLNPPGRLADDVADSYDTMLSSGKHTLRNYVLFRFLKPAANALWERTGVRGGVPIEGVSLEDARKIKSVVKIPVISTGGYQRASFIREAITSGGCDAVSIARPLLANPDLPLLFQRGLDEPEKPCSFCNRCLVHVLEDPLGCYDTDRFGSYQEMITHVMSFFEEQPWP